VEARKLIERSIREAAATSRDDRTRCRAALAHIKNAEEAQDNYNKIQKEQETLSRSLLRTGHESEPNPDMRGLYLHSAGALRDKEIEALRQQMDDAARQCRQEIVNAGVRLREYHHWLDNVLG
jgi:cellobiose-specific phosphotransferase system component IIA